MNQLYRKTFDQVEMSPDRERAVRDRLASRCSEKEAIMKKNHNFVRRPVIVMAAVVLVLALSLTAFAFGGTVYRFMTGGVVAGAENVDVDAIEPEQTVAPVEERDGRLYLVINGENKDITGLCSYTEPYIYTCTGSDGLQHAFVIGGDAGAIGWAEFFWDENGLPMAGSAAFGTNGGSDDAPWLNTAMEQLDLPWAKQG